MRHFNHQWKPHTSTLSVACIAFGRYMNADNLVTGWHTDMIHRNIGAPLALMHISGLERFQSMCCISVCYICISTLCYRVVASPARADDLKTRPICWDCLAIYIPLTHSCEHQHLLNTYKCYYSILSSPLFTWISSHSLRNALLHFAPYNRYDSHVSIIPRQ